MLPPSPSPNCCSSIQSVNCWRSSSCYDYRTERIFKREPIADVPPLCRGSINLERFVCPSIPTKIGRLYWGVSCVTDISPYQNMIIWGVAHLPSSHPRVSASVVPLWTRAATSRPITFNLLFAVLTEQWPQTRCLCTAPVNVAFDI